MKTRDGWTGSSNLTRGATCNVSTTYTTDESYLLMDINADTASTDYNTTGLGASVQLTSGTISMENYATLHIDARVEAALGSNIGASIEVWTGDNCLRIYPRIYYTVLI